MKKNITENKNKRDISISAFRKYARFGLHKRNLSPFQIYRVIGGVCSSERGRLDLLAVYDTLRLLEIVGENQILSAVFEIYFATASHRLKKSDMKNRISRYAFDFHCDERTVYRRLAVARRYYNTLREGESVFETNLEKL